MSLDDACEKCFLHVRNVHEKEGVATRCVAGVALWPWEDPGRGRRAMEACLGLACVCAGDCADGSTLVCRAPSACVNEELSTATTRPLRSYCLVTTNVTWL